MLAFAFQQFAFRSKIPLARALARLAFFLFAATISLAGLGGCATTAVPVGDWARLSDLDLSDRSLDHVRVAVECGNIDRAGRLQQHPYRLCRSLKPWLSSLGADVVAAGAPVGGVIGEQLAGKNIDAHPDFTLWYVDGGVVDQQRSVISLLGSMLTGFLIPYVTSAASESELRLLDARGVEIDRQKLRIQEVTIFGWGALYAMIAHRDRQDEQALSLRFYQFAQNRLVSQVPGRDL